MRSMGWPAGRDAARSCEVEVVEENRALSTIEYLFFKLVQEVKVVAKHPAAGSAGW